MAQTNLTIRIDENVKREAEYLFNKIGMNMSTAINVFFRQAIKERGIPFQINVKTDEEEYGEYFNPHNMKVLAESIEQANKEETISFSISELEAMENGEISQRGLDFIAKHKSGTTTRELETKSNG